MVKDDINLNSESGAMELDFIVFNLPMGLERYYRQVTKMPIMRILSPRSRGWNIEIEYWLGKKIYLSRL